MAANLAVDLILRTLMSSPEFRVVDSKDWEAIAKLIPGSTPQQCSKRWKELQQSQFIPGIRAPSTIASPGIQNVGKLLKSALYHRELKSDSDAGRAQGNKDQMKHNRNAEQRFLDHENQFDDKDAESLASGHHQDERHGQRHSSKQNSRSDKLHNSSAVSHSQGPNMVIHVCDESKNLKQDFTCPRDLLIREMRYFAEYLSVEAQRWEEVDISVHCDVQIFDWLMKYVKKGLIEKSKKQQEDKVPKLEPNNVISILISSDFLKMDNLVTDCIHFCHENMSAIVSTPCNMNCINDKLVARIAELFNHNELDDVRDRKDKFKSKLFCKKIEELFDPNKSTICSPANANTMFRCSSCSRLITQESQDKLRCVLNRMTIDQRGRVSYSHVRDPNWDVNEFIQGLREKLKSWRDVYWRLWGSVNTMYCYRCGDYFPCCELGHCRYHTSSAEFSDPGAKSSIIVGVYPCCQQRVLPFDPTGQLTGCSYRDHRVNRNMTSSPVETTSSEAKDASTEETGESKDETADTNEHRNPAKSNAPGLLSSEGSYPHRNSPTTDQPRVVNNPVVVDDLQSHRSLVTVPFQRLMSARSTELNVFSVEETAHVNRPRSTAELERASGRQESVDIVEKRQTNDAQPPSIATVRRSRSRALQQQRVAMRKMRLPNREDSEHEADEDEDQPESEDTEPEVKVPAKPRLPRKVTSASRRDFSTFKSYKWDPHRSSRWNQDAQREEDQKRMNELVAYLTRQRLQQPQQQQQDKEKQRPKEFIGGLYSKLDFQFRSSLQPVNNKAQVGSTMSLTSQRSRKQAVK